MQQQTAAAPALSPEQRAWVEQARAAIDPSRLTSLLVELTNIASPTGEEWAIAEFAVDYLRQVGLDAHLQAMDEHRANAIGEVAGAGDGPTLLLCAPIDTAFTGDAAEDCPGVGLELP